jgi:hypothetical protein
MSKQRNSKKKQPGILPWHWIGVWLIGLFGLVVLTAVVANLNPSLRFLVRWSFGLFFVAAVATVLVQTWIVLHPGDCPKCGRKMTLPLRELFGRFSYSDSLRTIKFTCLNCGHVADSGIRTPWAGDFGGRC